MNELVIYGANGYSGRLIAREAVRRGLKPLLAGRSAEAIARLAGELGLPWRAFAVEDAARSLEGARVVLSAAGPFSHTARPMIDACAEVGAVYLDLNGDTAVFDDTFTQRDELISRGAVVIPGVGFDVAPSDCLAAMVARALPGATHLEVAWGGDFEPSRGTARSMLEVLPRGGLVRKEGALARVPIAERVIDVPFPSGPRTALSVPWGDVVTAYYSTGIPNIRAYAAMSRAEIWSIRLMRPLIALLKIDRLRGFIDRLIQRSVTGPDDALLANGRSHFWVRASRGDETCVATLSGPEGYVLTARASVEAMQRALADRPSPGVYTPSRAFGADFICSIDGITLSLPTPARAVERRSLGVAA
jgi:short subunit dehydrogenase-like uncharacterized protein